MYTGLLNLINFFIRNKISEWKDGRDNFICYLLQRAFNH